MDGQGAFRAADKSGWDGDVMVGQIRLERSGSWLWIGRGPDVPAHPPGANVGWEATEYEAARSAEAYYDRLMQYNGRSDPTFHKIR
jgi:hypothetical protein